MSKNINKTILNHNITDLPVPETLEKSQNETKSENSET